MLEARNKLEEYVEKYKHLKNPQVKEFRAVILRDLSLLDAREKGESSFDNAITKLTEAGKLLENLRCKSQSETGIFIRIGINQSIITLLKLKQTSSDDKPMLDTNEFENVIKLYEANGRNWKDYPFLLLTAARIKEKDSSNIIIKGPPEEIFRKAQDLYYRIGWDYFKELIEKRTKI